jgi:hypothetical protein
VAASADASELPLRRLQHAVQDIEQARSYLLAGTMSGSEQIVGRYLDRLIEDLGYAIEFAKRYGSSALRLAGNDAPMTEVATDA